MQQKKNIALLVVCLLVIAGAAAMGFHFKQAAEVPVGGAAQPESTVSSVDPSPQEDPGQSADNGAIAPKNEIFSDYMEQANQKLSTMTLEERVGQVFLARYPGEADAAEQIKTLHPGGYVLFANDFKDKTKTNVKQELKNCQSVSEIPLILGVDEEGGTVVRVSSNTALAPKRFSSPQSLYSQGGMAAVREDTRQKSQLLLELGLNLNLAPVADVSTDRSDFIYSRSFGMSAQRTAEYVENVVTEMNKENLSGVLKHFPGYGNNEDTHTGIARDKRPMSQFTETDFLPFSAGIEAGVPCVLVSHIIVECMDAEQPASLSAKVHQILRENLGFTGVIMTDDLSMEAITEYTGGENPAVAAFLAGNDMLMCSDLEQSYQALLEAVQQGEVTEERLNESVARILAWKYSKGILS